MNRKQLVSWCLCLVGQMRGQAVFISMHLRKKQTRQCLDQVVAWLEGLDEAIRKEYLD